MKNFVEEEGTCQLVEAFAEDTKAVATWPPRSYTCSFCKRDFRSAQALGGHMNVHRRDRAHLHHQAQAQPQTQAQTLTLAPHQPNVLGSASSVDPFINWANDVGVGVVSNKEMSLFYQFANNHNNGIVNNFELMSSFVNDDETMQVNEMSTEVICDTIEVNNEPIEELDLELRLGHFYSKIR
ncbi:uncharacterized protein LOC141651931 [Silene latifolia]|uniref:uncharacterized protein LOC141651931 n=1 Tax=Silene latifolia TaxID=37657 RepID=UPI003D784C25